MRRRVDTLTLPNPAAGHDWSVVLSTTDRVWLQLATAKLTTSSTAASRAVGLQVKNESGILLWAADLQCTQAASLAVTYSWSKGAGVSAASAAATGDRLSTGLPYPPLEPGDTLAVVTAALDTADQWSGVAFRFLVGDQWERLEMVEAFREALGA